MKWRGSDITVIVSLIVGLTIAALWMRGLFVRDELVTHVAGRKCLIAVYPHHLYVRAYLAPGGPTPTRFHSGLPQYPGRPIYWEFRYHQRPGGTLRLGVPFWLPLSFALAAPLWSLLNRIQTALRWRAGLCRACGYDLRASRERCPECGTPMLFGNQAQIGHRDTEGTEATSQDPARRYRTRLHWQITMK